MDLAQWSLQCLSAECPVRTQGGGPVPMPAYNGLQCLSAECPVRTIDVPVQGGGPMPSLQCLSAECPVRTIGTTLEMDIVSVVSNAFRRSVRLGLACGEVFQPSINSVSNAFRRSVRLGPAQKSPTKPPSPVVSNAFRRSVRLGRKYIEAHQLILPGLQCLSAECPVRTQTDGFHRRDRADVSNAFRRSVRLGHSLMYPLITLVFLGSPMPFGGVSG